MSVECKRNSEFFLDYLFPLLMMPNSFAKRDVGCRKILHLGFCMIADASAARNCTDRTLSQFIARIQMPPYHGTSLDDVVPFSSLQRYSAEMANERRGSATPPAELRKVFQAALAQCQVVSFDVFDTLLVRYVHHPMDVFLHLERTEPFRRRTRWPAPVWQLRQRAENQARQKLHQTTGSGEATLTEIYATFCELAQWKHPVAELVRAEEEVELKLNRPCPAIRDLYEMARAAGKPVIFVSDTYHHARFVREMLTANGFPATPESVFASSDLRLNKQSGQLFPRVVQRIGLEPAAILHVGDHPVSDFQQPQAIGIKAILHDHRASAVQPQKSFALPTAPLQTLLSGLASIESRCHWPARDFWWLVGYNVFGPLFTGFCSWLERCFRADGVTRAWFLLRDGEIFERIYRTLFPGQTVPTATLPSSRRAFLLPVLDLAPNLALSGLLSGVELRPVREYLERLQLPAEPFQAEFHASGFPDLDELINGRTEGERLFRLVRQPRVQAAMLERCKLEKELLSAFLEQEGLVSDQKIAIVDLGWRGSIHKALHLLLSRPNRPAPLIGYYLGTSAGFADHTVPGLAARGFLMHEGKPEATAQRISQFPQLLEIICSIPRGSLLHFERAAGRVQGVFQEPDASSEQHRQVATCHDGAVAFARDFARARWELQLGDEIPPLIAGEALFRVTGNPTKEEAVRLGGLTLSDNAGSTTRRACAQFRGPNEFPSLLEDYRKAYWKPGLLAQPNLQAATLRTLLWLMQD